MTSNGAGLGEGLDMVLSPGVLGSWLLSPAVRNRIKRILTESRIRRLSNFRNPLHSPDGGAGLANLSRLPECLIGGDEEETTCEKGPELLDVDTRRG